MKVRIEGKGPPAGPGWKVTDLDNDVEIPVRRVHLDASLQGCTCEIELVENPEVDIITEATLPCPSSQASFAVTFPDGRKVALCYGHGGSAIFFANNLGFKLRVGKLDQSTIYKCMDEVC